MLGADLRMQFRHVISGDRQRQSGAKARKQMTRQVRLIINPGVLFELRMSPDIGVRERFDRAGRFEGVFGRLRIESFGDLTKVCHCLLTRSVEPQNIPSAQSGQSFAA